MSQTPERVADRFNRISDVYDETREPLSNIGIGRVARILSDEGVKTILEAGVGTGRIARPLQERGLEIVGVDFSEGMLSKARKKGLQDLVMGDANHLPFEDKSFDAALLAHVLHLLDNPWETFEKLSRVAKKEVVVLVRNRDVSNETPSSGDVREIVLRQAIREAADEIGYSLPGQPGDWRKRFRNEIEFLKSHPPSELITIQDTDVFTTLGERLAIVERRAFGNMDAIPADIWGQLIERVKTKVDLGQEIRYRRVEQMAIWRLAT